MDEFETYLGKSDQDLVNDWMQVIRLREESEWLPVWGLKNYWLWRRTGFRRIKGSILDTLNWRSLFNIEEDVNRVG